ncbi:MAG: hypothetical protein IT340_06475 [Chloroflexi bacterium]|nr:hypothetical protein [Chloroflexota bacterium]
MIRSQLTRRTMLAALGSLLAACATLTPGPSPTVPATSTLPPLPTASPPAPLVPTPATQPTATVTPTPPPTAAPTTSPTVPPASPTPALTATHLPSIAPLAVPSLPPVSHQPPSPGLTDYTHPTQGWRVRYPADLLHVESLGPDLTVFISQDRATVAAVDSYRADGDEFGNTGEDLRNRARDALARLYGRPVDERDILAQPPAPWATGIAFTTALGSRGEAVYRQPDRRIGDFRVQGFLLGYKAATEATMRPLLVAMRASLTPPA